MVRQEQAPWHVIEGVRSTV